MKMMFKLKKPFIYLLIIFCDVVVLFMSDILSFLTVLGKDFYFSNNYSDYSRVITFIITFKVFCLYVFQLYTKQRYKSNFICVIYILKASTASMFAMALTAYFLRADSIPRPMVLVSWIYSILLISLWRLSAKRALEIFIAKDFFKSRLLIVGVDKNAKKIMMRLINDAAINYNLVGFIKCNSKEIDIESSIFPVLGSIEDVPEVIKKYYVDEVVLTSPNITRADLIKIFSAFRNKKDAIFRMTPDLYDGIISCSTICEKGIPIIPFSSSYTIPIWYPSLKRLLDLALSSILLLLILPIFIIIIVAIKATSPGPIFYITKRVGYMGKLFVMYKFRSMYSWPTHQRIEKWAQKSDKRITPIGKVLRRFRLDELPQLVNVLKNDMSLIGPRPESRYYVNRLLREIPMYSERFKVKPGITGWAQVNFKYAASIEDSEEKLLYDIYYIQNQSLTLDALITLKTFKTVATGTGAH